MEITPEGSRTRRLKLDVLQQELLPRLLGEIMVDLRRFGQLAESRSFD